MAKLFLVLNSARRLGNLQLRVVLCFKSAMEVDAEFLERVFLGIILFINQSTISTAIFSKQSLTIASDIRHIFTAPFIGILKDYATRSV